MKYFVISDVHGFYDEMIQSLTEAGYDKENHNHVLIVLGDIFDRGREPLQVYSFLRSIPKERRILVRGNHEILLKEMVSRGYAESHDEHNGTWQTVLDISNQMSDSEFIEYMFFTYYKNKPSMDSDEYTTYKDKVNKEYFYRRNNALHNSLIKEIIDWIDSDEWINFYETNDYIFVHSWIPVREFINFTKSAWSGTVIKDRPDEYREDWRTATQIEWNDAMWGCPWSKAKVGLNKTGKTIVCGHWHTSDIFNHLKNKNNRHVYTQNYNPIVKFNRYKLIALDACTVITHKINVFTFEE